MDKSRNLDYFGIYESDDDLDHQNVIEQEFSSTKLDHNKMNQKTTKVSEQTDQASEEIQSEQRIMTTEITLKKKRTKAEGRRSSHRWSPADHKKYIQFLLNLQIGQPYLNLSWKCWKPSNVYPQAAEFIGVDKEQVKSYDERMKNIWLKKQNKDLMDFVKDEAKKLAKKDDQIGDKLNKLLILQSQKSDHMRLLDQGITKMKQFYKFKLLFDK